MKDKQTWVGIIFILSVSLVFHFLFSRLGFNPTDDGFILAGSRRIIDGQVPHRDFISIRTPGSYFLHIPIVLLGDDYTLWLSRYVVWFQFACIAWVCVVVVGNVFNTFKSVGEKVGLGLAAFCFSAHFFPLMVWHTIDALFFVSLGMLPFFRQSSWKTKMVGYILIGASSLFRQNFILLIPLSVLLFNDWRQKRYWLGVSFPLLFYVSYLAINNALSDAILQLTTYSFKETLSGGIFGYLNSRYALIGVLMGCLAAIIVYDNSSFGRIKIDNPRLRTIGVLILFAFPLVSTFYLALGTRYLYSACFALFGATIGILAYLIFKERRFTRPIKCGIIMLVIAWSASLSIGYNTPALVSGPLVLFLVGFALSSFRYEIKELLPSKNLGVLKRFFNRFFFGTYASVLTVLLVISSTAAFVVARENYIYRDLSGPQLSYDLGGVLLSANLILTNNNTYTFLRDLQVAESIAKEKGDKYAIIPDVAVNWVKSPQANPLSIDWSLNTELGSQKLVDRVVGDLESQRGTLIIIVQKYEAYSLASELKPLSDSYTIVQYVRSHFEKLNETQFFELYG
jgi:hypothetical protein